MVEETTCSLEVNFPNRIKLPALKVPQSWVIKILNCSCGRHTRLKRQYQNRDHWANLTLGRLLSKSVPLYWVKHPFSTLIQDMSFVNCKPPFFIGVDENRTTTEEEKGGPTLKPSTSRLGTYWGQNSCTLAHWSPFWNQHFQRVLPPKMADPLWISMV